MRRERGNRWPRRSVLLGLFAAVALVRPVAAATPAGELAVSRVATADQPIFVTAPPGDTARLFIVERGGAIRIFDLDTGTLAAAPFLTVPDVNTAGEGGLLGLAFHPDYADNGRLYVAYTNAAGPLALKVAEFRVSGTDPALVEPATAVPVLAILQPQSNHNGGWIGFGPDGYLYIASGDGGGSNDAGPGHTPGIGNAQDPTDNLSGKILRIDVDGDDFPADETRNYAIPATNPFVGVEGDDEIWALGLRNPWRASFDRLTGDFYIGDVGQNAREEINFEGADSAGGLNYGWRLREGGIATPTGGVGGPPPPGNVDPLYEYLHGSGPLEGASVTGGYVYRGPETSLQGQYFFADFARRQLWSFEVGHDGTPSPETALATIVRWNEALRPPRDALPRIASFGEDARGNLYFVDLGGGVYRIDGLRKPAKSVPGLPPWAAMVALACVIFVGWCAIALRVGR